MAPRGDVCFRDERETGNERETQDGRGGFEMGKMLYFYAKQSMEKLPLVFLAS